MNTYAIDTNKSVDYIEAEEVEITTNGDLVFSMSEWNEVVSTLCDIVRQHPKKLVVTYAKGQWDKVSLVGEKEDV